MSATYRTLTVPRAARLTAGAAEPAVFYARLLDQALNHGMPARRRGGRVLAIAGRRGLPLTAVAAGLRCAPRSRAPHLDRLLEEVAQRWPELSGCSSRLPQDLPRLSALELERSSSTTVFVFGQDPLPLLVQRRARRDHSSVERERGALLRAEPAGVAPRVLPDVGGALTTEGLPGFTFRVQPVTSTAARLPWTPAHDGLGKALVRLAEVTSRPGTVPADLLAAVERSTTYDFPGHRKRQLRAVLRDLSRLPVQMLQHKDLSAQNWLVDGPRFVGIVDWEMSVPHGVPAFDVLHCATALLEHGLALHRWSEPDLVERFEEAWTADGLFRGARGAAQEIATAAGVPAALVPAVEVGYFARRLGRAMEGSAAHDVSVRTLASMLGVVCAG